MATEMHSLKEFAETSLGRKEHLNGAQPWHD